MSYKAQPSAVQCCGGRGPGKGRNDCVLCVSDDLSQCPSDAGSHNSFPPFVTGRVGFYTRSQQKPDVRKTFYDLAFSISKRGG